MILSPSRQWFNPPPFAEPAGSALVVRTAENTDFWQKTHYGFSADSGHFLWEPVSSDFRCTTTVTFRPVHQYDQAGLMVRVSESCWLKTSVEYEPDGPSRLGAVVTNSGYSDWSTQDFDRSVRRVSLRIDRTGPDYTVYFRTSDAEDWHQLRLARLLDDKAGNEVHVGLYACSPKGAGYEATFENLQIGR